MDGGASASNLLLQFQSNILNVPVQRPKVVETTALGAAYLAGLAVGVWKDLSSIESNRIVDRLFEPDMNDDTRARLVRGWTRAVERSQQWIEEDNQ